MSETIRLLLWRGLAILGYVPNLAFCWFLIGPGWREEHRKATAMMWRGGKV